MTMDTVIRIDDITLPAGVEAIGEPDMPVVTVLVMRGVEEEEAEAAEGAEGEAAEGEAAEGGDEGGDAAPPMPPRPTTDRRPNARHVPRPIGERCDA